MNYYSQINTHDLSKICFSKEEEENILAIIYSSKLDFKYKN